MPDVEKITKALECCEAWDRCASDCPYNIPRETIANCTSRLAHDVLALLKDSRLTPRKPWHTKVKYASGEEWITDQCPECVKRGAGIWDTLLDRHKPFCHRCGQALDWSEYDGREQIDWGEYMSHVSERA